MILRLTCPKCHADSYSPSVENFSPCPYCGLLFSGKYGTEKRKEERIIDETPVIISYKGQNLEAKLLDFSKRGLRLKISDEPSLTEGDTVKVDIGNRHVNAQVLWVSSNKKFEDMPDSCCAGLKVLD